MVPKIRTSCLPPLECGWHLKLRLGKKNSSTDGVAAQDDLGGRLAPANVYH
jgi:hypothetical protein